MAKKKVRRNSVPLTRDQWMERAERLEFLSVESGRRKVDLEPMFYGAPDLLFKRGQDQGYFDVSTKRVVRVPLDYEETAEQYRQRQDQALYDFVTQYLTVVKDDKIIPIRLIPKMAAILGDLFYERVDKLILWANRGGGKSCPRGTPVIMADGCVETVENIRVGDRLMGPDGKARTVQGTQPGHGPLYRITPVKGEPWECNEHHILTLVKQGHQNGGGEIIDIGLMDYLAKHKTFRESYKQFSVGVDEFESSDYRPLEIDPYFLGVWFGDGSKNIAGRTDGSRNLSRVWVTKADPEIRQICVDTAAQWGTHCKERSIDKQLSDCPTFMLTTDHGQGNPLLDELRETVGPDIKVPDAILRGTREVRLQFLAGFLDTDAELHHNGYVIAQKREDWARAVWWIARSLGLMATTKEITKSCQNEFTGTYHQVSISGHTDEIPLRIPRKQAQPRKQRKCATRTGITVEPIGDGDYYGFMLDGDGRFLLGDFTVTHNSLLAAVFMWISFVYKRKSCLNMGGAGNQARRVYDYTKQFWYNFPGMLDGMLAREPLLQSTEMKNGSKLICSTSVSTAIGEHIGCFLADEASLLPAYRLLTQKGVMAISAVATGDQVLGREGHYQEVLEQFSHPYDGRILQIAPYGGGFRDWITEEHRVWGFKAQDVPRARRRKLPNPEDCGELVPDWIRAHDLEPGDVLCFPRYAKAPGTFVLPVGSRELSGTSLWRFLGYWAGDGGAPTGSRGAYPIKLHLSEAKHRFFEDVETLLGTLSTGSVNRSQPPSRGKAVDIVASSDKDLWEVLRNNVGIGADRGFPLEWLEQASDEELRHWLRGYLRTDGNREFSSTKRLSAWCLTTTAEGLALNVIYAFNRLGVPFYFTRRGSARYGVESLDRWDFKILSTAATRILEDCDFDGLELPTRELPAKMWFDDDWCYTFIREIQEDHYEGEVYDLRMGGDPSFGGPAFAMLHNCTDRPGADLDLMRAMQGAMSEEPHTIFLLSTFHLPTGFFADCVLPGEMVLTSEGWTIIEDVAEGTLVMGADGGYHPVSKVWSKNLDDTLVVVTPRGYGRGIKVTSKHPLLVEGQDGPEWRYAGDVRRGDWLVFPRPQRKPGPSSLQLVGRGSPGRVPLGPEFYRWFGYWLGDGSNSGRLVTFSKPSARVDLLEDFAALTRLLFDRAASCTVRSGAPYKAPFTELSVGCKSLCAWLDSECRTLDRQKRVPLWLLERATPEELLHFITGLLRTDGQHDGTKIMLRTTSSSIAAGVFYASLRLGLAPGVGFTKTAPTKVVLGRVCNQRDVHALWWSNESAADLVEHAFGERPEWGPARGISVEERRILVRISKVEKSPYKGPVWDVMVPGSQSFAMPWAIAHNTWHSAEELGFTKVTWNCFSTMSACRVGMEMATAEDPKAIESFCKPECSLSWEVDTYDEFGNITGSKWEGCLGVARESSGWQTRKMVLEEQKINQGTRIFTVEHACIKPEREGHIYNRALIEACLAPYFNLCMDRRKVVGIDWGLTQCAMVLIGEWVEPSDDPVRKANTEGVGVLDVVYMSNRLVDVVVEQIRRWQLRYGDDVLIRADGSHPYCNRELATHGYHVIPVHGDRKLLGEDNLARWVGSGAFKILEGFELFVTQLHNLRRNVLTGKQLKRNLEGDEGDHGPDALKFAMMQFDFVRWTQQRQKAQEQVEQKTARRLPSAGGRRGGLDSLLF